LKGREPISEPLPTTEALERAFVRRVEQLLPETQMALLVAAAGGTRDFEEVVAAVEQAGVSRSALDPAEQAGLTIVVGSSFDFAHPLLRAAVYQSAPAVLRRAAHEAVASVSRGERRAWHRAAASPAPDSSVAAELEQAATAARRRGGHAEAAAAFEQAARLADSREEQSRLLRDAADEARRAGLSSEALALLDAALAKGPSTALAARINHLHGVIEMWSGATLHAAEGLRTDASAIEMTDPGRAAWLLTDAGWAFFMAGEIEAGRAAAERAVELARGVDGLSSVLATALLGIALLINGRRTEAEPLLRSHESMLDDREFVSRSYSIVWPAAQALTWLGEHERAREIFTQVVEEARRASAPSLLPYTLTGLAELDFRTGAWTHAYANATEAIVLATQTEQPTALGFALAGTARIEAAQGRADECEAHASEVLRRFESGASRVFAVSALGLLELGRGRSESAVDHLEQVDEAVHTRGLLEPNVSNGRPT
jgi:tetratricopeptide (TPR) repeat protein